MPVYPSQKHKMKPDTEYALYYDGPDGVYITYYSATTEDRTVKGQSAKDASRRLYSNWELVQSNGTPDGMYVYFKRDSS